MGTWLYLGQALNLQGETMSRLLKLIATAAVILTASLFAAPKAADAGYGYGYGYGYSYYRPYYSYNYYTPSYYPSYSYGYYPSYNHCW